MSTAKTLEKKPKKSIFDTRFDTKPIHVSPRNRFSLRTHTDRAGKNLIYLDINDGKNRIRISTEIHIPKINWDAKKQRIKNLDDAEKLNLVLANIEARIVTIKTNYMLQERPLTAKKLLQEFQSATPDFDFISFMRYHLKHQDFKNQTIKNHNCVIKKVEKFQKEIPFHEITMSFFKRYRKFYPENSDITYNTDLKVIKKYLQIAKREGIRLNISLEDLKVNVHSNRTVYLNPDEMQQLIKYYYNEFINPSHVLPLGYFLFSCYTGLRISDVQKRTREEILADKFHFSSVKTDQLQYMKLTDAARKLVNHAPQLFVTKLSDQKINAHLKSIAKVAKVDKNITMHVGRHTFATTFIRNKGDIYRLQKLLGHANIRHTQKYIHLVNSEFLDDVDLVSY